MTARLGEAACFTSRGEATCLRTVAVRRGTALIELPVAPPLSGGRHQVAWARGPLVEKVTTTARGFEQAWRFEAAPRGEGALEIDVRVMGPRRPSRAGTGLNLGALHYGAATWVDARGARTAVGLIWDDGLLRLQVPDGVLRGTVWPATLDPVISAETSVGGLTRAYVSAPRDAALAWNGTHFVATWHESRNGIAEGVYAARVDRAGTILDPWGVIVSSGAGPRRSPAIACNPGLCLIAWVDERSGDPDLYVTRFSAAGQVLEPQGVPLAALPGAVGVPSVNADGAGFAVFWADERAVAGQGQLFGATVAASSTQAPVVTPTNGVRLDVGTPSLRSPRASWDGAQHLLIWSDFRDGTTWRIFGARVSPTLTLLDPAGVLLSPDTTDADHPVVTALPGLAWAAWDEVAGTNRRQVQGTRWVPGGAVLDAVALDFGNPAHSRLNPAVTTYAGAFQLYYVDTAASRVLHAEVLADGGVPLDGEGVTHSSYETRSATAATAGDTLAVLTGASSDLNAAWHSDGGDVEFGDLAYGSNPQTNPALAWNGRTWLVTWLDETNNEQRLMAARVAADGGVLDPAGIELQRGYGLYPPRVASNGTDFLVVYMNDREIDARRVSASGAVLDVSAISVAATDHATEPDVASNGQDYFVAWQDDHLQRYDYDVFGTGVSASGLVNTPDGTRLVPTPRAQRHVSLAWDGTRYLLAWDDEDQGAWLGTIDAPLAPVVSPAGGVHLGVRRSANPSVAATPGRALVAWEEDRQGPVDLYALLLPPGPLPTATDGGVLTAAPGDQAHVRLAADPAGFAAVWEDLPQGASQPDVHGVRLTPTGAPLEAESTLAASANCERLPAVALDGRGHALVAYQRVDETPPFTSDRLRLRTWAVPQPLGVACGADADCEGGHCADGVCCDTACGAGAGDCQACAVAQGATVDGTCRVLVAGARCRAAASVCDFAEQCDGLAVACPADGWIADGTTCGTGVCQRGQCLVPGDAGAQSSAPPVITSTAPSSATCHEPLQYTPTVAGQGPFTFSVQTTDGAPVPEGVFLNPTTGELLYRPRSAGTASFELVAYGATGAAMQPLKVTATCAPLQAGCECDAVGGRPLLLVAALWLLRRRRARQSLRQGAG